MVEPNKSNGISQQRLPENVVTTFWELKYNPYRKKTWFISIQENRCKAFASTNETHSSVSQETCKIYHKVTKIIKV